jgi:hypothetical protein
MHLIYILKVLSKTFYLFQIVVFKNIKDKSALFMENSNTTLNVDIYCTLRNIYYHYLLEFYFNDCILYS